MQRDPIIPNLKNLPFGGAASIADADAQCVIEQSSAGIMSWLADTSVSERFINRYRSWIAESQQVTGLDAFACAVQTNGTSEAFDKFYMGHHRRRFRCFRGEYMYHPAVWRNCWPDWCWLHEDRIRENDAVVISQPFAGTGDEHPLLHETLTECSRLGVPVLIDCTYFGITPGVMFDLTAPCIHTVTFSLGKTFPVAHARTGVRFTRADDDDPCVIYQKTNYTNRIAAGIGLALMDRFNSDYIPKKYQQIQQDLCQQLGDVEPAKCVIFGRGGERWSGYDRGDGTFRLALHRYLASGQLPSSGITN